MAVNAYDGVVGDFSSFGSDFSAGLYAQSGADISDYFAVPTGAGIAALGIRSLPEINLSTTDVIDNTPELVVGAYSLVGANKAIIDPRKIFDYALNLEHPVGGNKARVFESAYGFNQSNGADLMQQLLNGVTNNTPTPALVDRYGERFTVEISVVGPRGSGPVVSGWIFKPGSNVPELTSVRVKN